jgi:hypothetical protein
MVGYAQYQQTQSMSNEQLLSSFDHDTYNDLQHTVDADSRTMTIKEPLRETVARVVVVLSFGV